MTRNRACKANYPDEYERVLGGLKKEFGADSIQGFYFSRPLPPDEAIRYSPNIA